MGCFRRDMDEPDIIYEGDGNWIARRFYIPVLKQSILYDRISGYFGVDCLVVVAAGLAGLIRNKGRMRLIVGAHDIGPDLSQAYLLSRERAQELLADIGRRIAEGLDKVEDIFSRRRLEALAWMLANGTLEVRVVIPKKTFLGLGNGIFHQKRLLFRDDDGCVIAAAGSANETRAAYEANGENLTIHMSWRPGHQEYLSRYAEGFEALWNDQHPDYYVFTLPEAIERRLRERFYLDSPPKADPLEEVPSPPVFDPRSCAALVPAALLVKDLGSLEGLTHLGLGPVRLYEHQAFTVDFVLSRFPHRVILADEVGLGKTLEAGAVIKRLVDSGQVQRALVLAPKNVARQWLDELWYHFGLRFWLLETSPIKQFRAADGTVHPIGESNPFDKPGFDFIVASWHYARGTRKRQPELLSASRFFDLVVIDEAHAARLLREPSGVRRTRLNELCSEIGIRSPHLLLLTATPIQLYEVEAHDLLRILGLGGPWVDEDDFRRYYQILMSPDSPRFEEWLFAFKLARWVANSYLTSDESCELVKRIFGDSEVATRIRESIERDVDLEPAVKMVLSRDPDGLKRLLLGLSPLQWFMVRNTRERLARVGYTFPERDVEEEPVRLDPVHEELLLQLDDYLRNEYAKYEKVLSEENRGVIGFVRSIYHQRFVSSFTAAYLTLKHRKEFLEALLRHDREALLQTAAKVLEEEEWEGDEEDVVEAMEEALEGEGYRLILRELERVGELASKLMDYAPETLSARDPKLQKVLQVVDDLVARGHKVLVFSKYTDTVDAVVRFLARGSRFLSKHEIGVYTGAGGKLYDEAAGSYVSVGKEDVRRALDEGPVRVLVCSDAAREGLNLQAASAVVNVDMPWNPAKVEQRIGRVDRLGQRAPRVIVRNVWYPNSIEAEMYRVLFQRREIYGVVVGPGQEIVSRRMREALDEGLRGEDLRNLVRRTLSEVERVKEMMARSSPALLGRVWEGGRSAHDDAVVERVTAFALKAASALGLKAYLDEGRFVLSVDPPRLPAELMKWNPINLEVGKPNAMTPAHPIVRWLAESVLSAAGAQRTSYYGKSIYVVKDHNGVGRVFMVESEVGAPEILPVPRVIKLLDELLAFPDGGR